MWTENDDTQMKTKEIVEAGLKRFLSASSDVGRYADMLVLSDAVISQEYFHWLRRVFFVSFYSFLFAPFRMTKINLSWVHTQFYLWWLSSGVQVNKYFNLRWRPCAWYWPTIKIWENPRSERIIWRANQGSHLSRCQTEMLDDEPRLTRFLILSNQREADSV